MKTHKLTCEKARNISIVKTLENLGHFPKKKSEKEAWFLSPFRSETQASFKVDLRINRWYDHGAGKGGNVIDLITQLSNFTIPEALAFLSNGISSFSFHQQPNLTTQKSYTIDKVQKLSNSILIDYLTERKINQSIAKEYCKEIYYTLNDSRYFSIAFENDLKGYETRNEYFKGCLGPKCFSLLKNNSTDLIVFEGFIDFLSYATLNNNCKHYDFLILNSLSILQKAESLFKKYDMVYMYLDNDRAGTLTTDSAMKKHNNIIDESYLYKNYKDLNAFLMDDFLSSSC